MGIESRILGESETRVSTDSNPASLLSFTSGIWVLFHQSHNVESPRVTQSQLFLEPIDRCSLLSAILESRVFNQGFNLIPVADHLIPGDATQKL